MYRVFRAGYITGVAWCAVMLIVAYYVWTPGKWRPGSIFTHDVAPRVLELSFSLFWIGAAWSLSSKQARDSISIKWSVCVAFAAFVLAQLIALSGV